MSEPRPLTREELFDRRFLEAVRQLRLYANRVPRGGRFAEQRSQDMGHGLEFRDFRAYAPGDDVRSIDWNIYRRLGKVFLRLFEEFQDLPLYLLPDVSASHYLEEPPRARAGLRAALALGAISLRQHDPVTVFPFAEELKARRRPAPGRERILGLVDVLSDLPPGAGTDLERSLRRFGALPLRKGLVVIVSDFFDPNGVAALEEGTLGMRHGLMFVQLTRAQDANPAMTGDLRLKDCESGDVQDVSLTEHVRERYRAAYRRFDEGLATLAKRRGAVHVRLDSDADVLAQLARILEARRFVA